MPASKNVSLWYTFLYTFHCWDSVIVFWCLLGVLVYRKFPFWKRLTEIDYLSHNMWKLVLAKPGHTTLKIVYLITWLEERGGSVVECRTPEREVRGSRPTAAVLCPWARHFTPRKYWLITQEAMAPSRHDWKIVDWDVKPQHNQP